MHAERRTIVAVRRALPAIVAVALAVFMTWPLARDLGSVGRTGVGPNANPHFGSNGDGMFSLWNVSWVARTIVADPLNLFQANIFHPHRDALAYSEANIVAGVLGVPVWWTTKNPYATLNVVILIGFATAWLFTWQLVRYLTRDAIGAAVAASFYAFCPYVFAHTAHIQLMLTGGIPLAMLALHRLADAPSRGRGIALGGALLLQALACAYYGIFAGLMVAFAVVLLTISRSLWRNKAWLWGVVLAAAVAVAGVAPFLIPYFDIRQEAGFTRTLDESIPYSANASSYLASSAAAHQWLLDIISGWPKWNEVMFPGLLPLILGTAGAVLAAVGSRRLAALRDRETAVLYGSLGLLAFWASFGPRAGLYSVLFHIPVFSFLRAPSRMAIVVVLCLAVLAALAVRRLLNTAGAKRSLAGGLLCAAALGELWTAMPWERAVVPPGAYEVAARLPRAPLVEFPFYGIGSPWHYHTQYMLFSTAHWLPMMNGYSDYTPAEFLKDAAVLSDFPSRQSFTVFRRARVRYIGVHWDMYGPRALEIRTRLQPFRPHLRLLAASPRLSIYEIISFP